jgi:hypothetical protein
MSEKALQIFKDFPKFSKYSIAEGKYIYGRNGEIMRVDRSTYDVNKNVSFETNEQKGEENNVESKRGRKQKETVILDNSIEFNPQTLLNKNES